jgi:hypothetical protein
VFAPVGTRSELITRINGESRRSCARRRGAAADLVGLDATGGTPAQFSDNIKADLQRWARIIRTRDQESAALTAHRLISTPAGEDLSLFKNGTGNARTQRLPRESRVMRAP